MSAPSLSEQCEEAIAVLCGHDETLVRKIVDELYCAYSTLDDDDLAKRV